MIIDSRKKILVLGLFVCYFINFHLFAGKLCIEVTPASKIAFISEELCIGCGICVKVCASYGLCVCV